MLLVLTLPLEAFLSRATANLSRNAEGNADAGVFSLLWMYALLASIVVSVNIAFAKTMEPKRTPMC